MEIYYSFWHLVNSFFVFIFGAIVTAVSGRRFGLPAERSIAIYLWHSLLCMLYLWYVVNFGGDAVGYFLRAQNQILEFDFGTAAVDYMSAFVVQGLGLSLLGAFLFFNIFGSVGLLAFDGCLKTATLGKPLWVTRLATLIIFLPSISFWSSALGKDSLSFLAVGLSLWAALDLGRRVVLMVVAVAIMLLVRPHMAGMMVIALSISGIFDPVADFKRKALLGGISAAAFVVLVPFALNYAGIGDSVDVKSLSDYMEERQSKNMEGGGAIDISNMSLPVKFYTYMFRPMLFEATSVFSLAAAIDNVILVYLFVSGILALRSGVRSELGENRAFMWVYAFIAWLVLATTTSNLGIALRQKWMFAPMLIFLFISLLGVRSSDPDQNDSRF